MSTNYKTIYTGGRLLSLLFLVMALLYAESALAQSRYNIHGTVYEQNGDTKTPLDFAAITIPEYKLVTTSSNGGHYQLSNLPAGKVRISVQYVGCHTIDTLVTVTPDMHLDFCLQVEDFHLQEVTVTATNKKTGASTATNISRQAMDHLQATNLSDVMALLPGGQTVNSTLSSARTIEIRQGSGYNSSLNSLGASIIRDGAPMSNNANLSVFSPATSIETESGWLSPLGGGSSPADGVDARQISTENIESIEVIRGIPSVEYGDLTSGAVIIHSKAGREPLRIRAKANPNVYQGSIGTGFDLGQRKGALNLSADYAYNVNDPKQTYLHYQRFTAKALYSNMLFNGRLISNTGLDIYYGKDQRDHNPVDDVTMTKSHGKDFGLTLNTNGLLNINKGWLRNIRYVLSGSYSAKDSYFEEATSSGNAPYSGVMTDGTILSNTPGEHLYDADGTEITHFAASDARYFAYYLPNSYIMHNRIDSKEINVFAKVTANFLKNFGKVNNRILLGVDFKTDGNEGRGTSYDQTTPPLRPVYFMNGTYRPRDYRDIPWITQMGLFAEENLELSLGSRKLNLQAGLRYDNCSVVGGTLSPRINASFDVVPGVFTIRGGYGITAKMPTLLYLYPENAYFEYTAINELANEDIAEADRKFVTTTRVFDTQNNSLKVARNHKAEIGFDLKIGKANLSVTAFDERLKNGYSLSPTLDAFQLVPYIKLARNEADPSRFDVTRYQVLSCYDMPCNSRFSKTRGVEFELNLGRIDAIRTSFQLNGAFMRSDAWFDGYTVYENNSENPSTRHDVGIYASHAQERHDQSFSTALRITHNIPRLGFVVTLTAQATWQQMDWTTFYNDSIPVGYMSVSDGQPHFFAPREYTSVQQLKDAGMSHLIDYPLHAGAVRESYSPYFCFNLNLTKEISDMLRVSFYANNVFRSYPRRESKRDPGYFTTMNNRFFFGMELALKL